MRYWHILLILVLLLLCLLLAGGWLLNTRSGALWLVRQAGTVGPVSLQLKDLQGSLLEGLALQGLTLDWPGGQMQADQLQVKWHPAALLRQQLELELLEGNALLLRLDKQESADPAAVSERRAIMPDLSAFFAGVGDWSINLQSLQVSSLQLVRAEKKTIHLKQLAASLDFDATRMRLQEGRMDGDLGLWQGSLHLSAVSSKLDAGLSWQPVNSFSPVERLEADLALKRTRSGGLAGPVVFRSQGGQVGGYRLAGELLLDLTDLRLRELQFNRGTDEAGLIDGDLQLDWSQDFSWQTALQLKNLDLTPEFGYATQLSGEVDLEGTATTYQGLIDLKNTTQGWQRSELAGHLEGDADRLSLKQLRGALLGGEVQGEFELAWRDRFSSKFQLTAAGLQLNRLPEGPDGRIDLQLEGTLDKEPQSELQLRGAAKITRGVLLGREFSGDLRGEWLGGRRIKLDQLALQGGWGALQAQGEVQNRLDLQLQLIDATKLWQPLAGKGEIAGWLAWSDDWLHGDLQGKLSDLAYKDWFVGEAQLQGQRQNASDQGQLHLELADVRRGATTLQALNLDLQGAPASHRIQAQIVGGVGRATLELQGSLQQEIWVGTLTALNLAAEKMESFHLRSPADLHFGPESALFSEIALQGDSGGGLFLIGNLNRQDESAFLEGNWQNFDLSWVNVWLPDVQISGGSNGQGIFRRNAQGETSIDLLTDYIGSLVYADQLYQFDKAQISGRWDNRGLVVDADFSESRGAQLKFSAESAGDFGQLTLKDSEILLDLKHFPLEVLNAKMPTGTALKGRLDAEISGRWLGANAFTLTGTAGIEEGIFRYLGGENRLELPLKDASLNFDWQAEALQAEARLDVGDGAGFFAQLQLGLPARWPIARAQGIPLHGAVKFQLGELGVLSLLAADMATDFDGKVDGDIQLGGTLLKPDFQGTVQLLEGRIRAPQLGIDFDRAELQAHFEAHKLKIEKISLHAGEGQLTGKGSVEFEGWQPKKYFAELQGERVLIVNLPEIRVVASPDLRLIGTSEDIRLEGVLKIPELQIINWHPQGQVVRSEDVVYIDQMPQPESRKSQKYKVDIAVELGEKVVVKDRGLDVKLKGKVQLRQSPGKGMLARGQIDIPEGHYSAYGVKLPITSGRLFFNGGAVDNPALDIIAARKISSVTNGERREVSAGVAVGGTVRKPEIHLFSDPVLDDTEILSYIVLGRATSGGRKDFSALSLAAGALLSASDSASLQQKLSIKSGLDVIDLVPDQSGNLETSMVTVGKYLTPELFLSYGRSLSGRSNQVQLRYRPGERVDLESQLGEVSGVDLYYRIEFDNFSGH